MARVLASLLVVACLFGGFVLAEEPDLTTPDPVVQFWNNIMKHPFEGAGLFQDDTTFGYMMNHLELGVYLRARYEDSELRQVPRLFGPSAVAPNALNLDRYGDEWSDWVSTRAMLSATVPLTQDLRFYGQLINLNVIGDNGRFKRITDPSSATVIANKDVAIHNPELDFYQAYGEWDNFITRGMGIKVGRFEINYGEGWILSNQPFYSGLSFEAAKVSVKTEQATVDFFAAEVAPMYKPAGPTYPRIYGAYCSYTVEQSTMLDVFGFYSSDEMSKQDMGMKSDFVDESRYTVGSRLHGNLLPDLDYDLNGAYQFGQTGAPMSDPDRHDDVSAYALQGGIGKTFQEAAWTPRFGFKAAYASGNANPGDGDNEAYNPLYRDLHALNGYADAVKFSNLIDYALEASVKPYDRLLFGTEVHLFYFADRPANTSSKLAKEWDLFAKVKATDQFSIEAAYAMFVQDEAFRDQTGKREHNQRMYINLEYSF